MIESERDDSPGRCSVESVSTVFYYVSLRGSDEHNNMPDCRVFFFIDSIGNLINQQIIQKERVDRLSLQKHHFRTLES